MTMPAEKDVDRIRERAYELWQQDGCPDGRSLEYWLRAEADLAGTTDAAAGAAAEPAPAMDEPAATAAPARRRAARPKAAIVADAPAPASEQPAAPKATRRKQG